VAEHLRAGGVRLMLATNGMRLESHAADVGRLFDEVYVSLDGATPSTHDGVRGVDALRRISAGVAAVSRVAPKLRLVARSTLHARNLHEVEMIVEAARLLGFHGVSFLPLDAASLAFGGDPGARRGLVPTPEQVDAFEEAVSRMESRGVLDDGFVLESASKLRRLARHLRASGGHADYERPECDAPWWSSVVEADGSVRPCFFHEAVGDARQGLASVRSSEKYRRALGMIRGPNTTCERCVCPKRRRVDLLARVRA
jgi:MoaA/NifB/PqqE/SkfB family radical SAM enzyme